MSNKNNHQNKNVFNTGFSDSLKSDLETERIRIKDTVIPSFKPKLFEGKTVLVKKFKNQSKGGLNTRTKLIEFRELVVSIAMIESRPLSAVEIHNILLKKRSLARKSTLAFKDKLKLKWVAEVLNNSARFARLSPSYLFVATDEQDDIGNTRFKLDLES